MEGLIGPETAARLERAMAGHDEAQYLLVADLDVGAWGVLRVQVAQVHAPRTFQRKRGGEGMVGRVTLADASGEIDLVLWDAEIEQTRTGPLRPGAHLIVRGATVKAGWKGGLELGLGSAVIETQAPSAEGPTRLTGTLVSLEATRPMEVMGVMRFQAEATIETAEGPAIVIAWDDAIKGLQVEPGESVTIDDAVANPTLDGVWIAGY